ncbi:MAG: acyltransferase [Bacillota bacterium]|nr:acyltransferase [Bacillota bacterium]
MREHLQEFDLIRVIATFTVIGIHITAGYVLVSPAGYLGNQLARFAVPLFIIMSGFLLQYADLDHPLDTGVFYRKRFDRILWPYVLWSLFYIALTSVLSGQPVSLPHLPSQILWGTGYYHLYFVIIIIQLYLLYPFLRKMLLDHPRVVFLCSLLITLASQIILYQNMLSIISLPAAYNMIYLVCFPVWIFYFVLGMMTALYQKQWKSALHNQTVIIGVIWFISFVLLMVDSHYRASYGSSIRPSVMLYSVSSYFFFYVLALRFTRALPVWVSWIAKQSFLIFLMHPFFLTAAVYLAMKIGMPNLWGRTRGMVTLYIAVTLVTLGATYLISLTPLAEKLGGSSHPIVFLQKKTL